MSWPKIIAWGLLGASSVPLHLFVNACVTEARASTNFQLIVAADKFLDTRSPSYSTPGVGGLVDPDSQFGGLYYPSTDFVEALA
jgi:hypothetical protein